MKGKPHLDTLKPIHRTPKTRVTWKAATEKERTWNLYKQQT